MTTTGTASFNPTVLQVIDGALRKCGVLADDETSAGSAAFNNTLLSLQGLIKTWQATGIHVWTEEEAILFPQPGQARYVLGAASTDNCCDANSYRQTTASAAVNQAAAQIPVASAAGLANGQNIGVLLTTGAMFWTTITVVAGLVVTLAAPLPAPVFSGAIVVAYTTAVLRPLKIPNMRLKQLASGFETPMLVLARSDYMDLPNKATPGLPNQFFYSPKLPQGELYIWPLPQQAVYGLRFTWYRPLFDVTDAAQTFDFPQEWILPLTWALAREVGPEFDMPAQRWQMIVAEAGGALDIVQGWDRESEPIQFGMSWES